MPTPNTPGHLHLATGRLCVTVAQAWARADVDTPLYLYNPAAEELGVECWRSIDGIDPHAYGLLFDLWFANGGTTSDVPGNRGVYLSRNESAERMK